MIIVIYQCILYLNLTRGRSWIMKAYLWSRRSRDSCSSTSCINSLENKDQKRTDYINLILNCRYWFTHIDSTQWKMLIENQPELSIFLSNYQHYQFIRSIMIVIAAPEEVWHSCDDYECYSCLWWYCTTTPWSSVGRGWSHLQTWHGKVIFSLVVRAPDIHYSTIDDPPLWSEPPTYTTVL